MKAAFFGGKGQMRLAELDPPQPGPGEVVMAVTACGVCGSDLHSFAGQWPQPPVVPGHEMAGRVAAVGAGVTELAVGDAVTLEPFVPCGECRWCRSGHYNVCPQHEFISWHRHGGFAEQVLAPARCFLPLPEGPAREFGFLVEPLAVAVHALRRAPLRGADQVAVLGAGAIGLLAAAAAHALGAGRVVVVAKHPHQAELAEAMGAHAVVRLGEGKPDDIIRAAVGPDGADVVVDAAGSSQSIDLAVRAARRGGSLSLVGLFAMPPRTPLNEVIARELTVVGSNCYGLIDGRSDFAVAIDLLATGRVRPAPLITHRFALNDIQAAFETAAQKSSGAVKVVVG